MKIFQTVGKIILNYFVVMLQLAALFACFSSFVIVNTGDVFHYSFFSFFEKYSGSAANLTILILLIINICLAITFGVLNTIKKQKTLQNLIILGIIICINIVLIVLFFMFGELNNLGKFVSSTPMFVAMVLIVNIVFSIFRGAIEFKKNE